MFDKHYRKKMCLSSILFIGILSYSAFAIDLNIYKSVTEVRQNEEGTGNLNYVFKNGEYENIIDGSISWDGTPAIRQEIFNTIDSLKDASVIVRQATVCECNVINAKIVDPMTMLLENVDTGAYFYADPRSIEYTSIKPNNGGITLSIDFRNRRTKFNGTLSYLTRGITWSPNYDLFVTDGNCDLRGYANIRNNQQQDYQIDNTYLYSGDLQIAYSFIQLPVFKAGVEARPMSSGNAVAVPTIQFDGEQKGFYFYSLKTDYLLRSTSSIRLPYITTNPKCSFYYQAFTGISTGVYSGVFQRTYELTPNQFIPGGILTVRDNQVLIGQSNLPDVPENYTQAVSFGSDNDVRYSITGNQTAFSDDNTKIPWRSYQLDITISNFKNKPVRGQLNFYGASQTKIDQSTCKSTKLVGTSINYSFNLKANANLQCQLSVTLRWG